MLAKELMIGRVHAVYTWLRRVHRIEPFSGRPGLDLSAQQFRIAAPRCLQIKGLDHGHEDEVVHEEVDDTDTKQEEWLGGDTPVDHEVNGSA